MAARPTATRLAYGLVLLLQSTTGCLYFHAREGRVATLMHAPPVHITPADMPSGARFGPTVAIHPRRALKTTPHQGEFGPDVERVIWTLPRVQGGLSGAWAGQRLLSLAGDVQVGYARGEPLWAAQVTLGGRGSLPGMGLHLDLGLAGRKGAYSVAYSESYTEDDSTTSAAGHVRGSRTLWDGFVALTLNTQHRDAVNAFLTVELGIAQLLDFDVASKLVDDRHEIEEIAGMMSMTAGVTRRLDGIGDLLVGLRSGGVGSGQFAELFTRLDMPVGGD